MVARFPPKEQVNILIQNPKKEVETKLPKRDSCIQTNQLETRVIVRSLTWHMVDVSDVGIDI